MSLRRKVFTSQKISLFFSGKEYRLQALVSVQGVKYAFHELELPEEAKSLIGAEIPMTYKGLPARCRIVREDNPIGVLYNLRFVNPSQVLVRQIERDIRDSGLPSPWLRNLPRLGTDMKEYPSPALAVVYYRGETYYLNIKNFTLGGLLLELVGMSLPQIAIGSRLDFDMVTNQGDKFSDVAGVVTRVSAEFNERDDSMTKTFFGLKFLPMGMHNEAKYRELIREHCLLLKAEEQAEMPRLREA